ncbi:MAG: RNA polymerase subunit sigma [Candidatus Eisenbacteria bacterium]|nr:RNA polymerase subunit sigma [Candidatus Eisenbacteria bacterium]
MKSPGEVTRILARVCDGDRGAVDELFPLVYSELRGLAAAYMRSERPGHTLQPTALTHEAYLRLTREQPAGPADRAHFFALAARAMRRILVEHARARKRHKRGGGWARITLTPSVAAAEAPEIDLLALDGALTKLQENDSRKAQVVELLYFGGLTAREAAEVLGVTSRTVERDWQFSRLWLLREILGPDHG